MSKSAGLITEGYFDELCNSDKLFTNLPLPNALDNMLKTAVKVLGAESGHICLHDSNEYGAQKEKTTLFNLSWLYTNQYIDYYHKIDPFLKVIPSVKACRNIDLMPWSHWRNLEFYNDFVKPQKIRHLMVMYFQDDNRLIGHMGIHRDNSGSAFTQKEVFKAQYLASLFSRCIRQNQLDQKSVDLEKLLKKVIEASSSGILVLDSHLNPVYWNKKALELGFSPIKWPGNTGYPEEFQPILPDEIMSECRRMQKSLRNNQTDIKYNKRCVVLWANRDRRMEVEIEVVPSKQFLHESQNPFDFILVFNDINRTNFPVSVVKTLNGNLTPKEMEIAQCICQGLTNKEISDKLYIALSTVSTHVHHIFQKFDIKSRSKLFNVLRS